MSKTCHFQKAQINGCYSIAASCLGALLLLLAAVDSYAFGPTGHRVVGRIAENHLTPTAKRAVKEIMGRESLAQAATWPDEILHCDREALG